jgi:hypothetical protein
MRGGAATAKTATQNVKISNAKMAGYNQRIRSYTPLYPILYTQKPAETAATPHIRLPLYAKHYTSVRNRIQIPPKNRPKPDWHTNCLYTSKPKNQKRMTDKLKVWVENGKIAVEFAAENGEKMRYDFPHGPLFCTQNAIIVGDLAFTTYNTQFYVAKRRIKMVREYGEDLIVFAEDGLKIYDMRTGKLKETCE